MGHIFLTLKELTSDICHPRPLRAAPRAFANLAIRLYVFQIRLRKRILCENISPDT